MNVLVAFASTEGQTKKIAHHIETMLKSNGNSCTVINCADTVKSPDIASFDAVIVAGSVHEKRHQEAVTAFAYSQRDALKACPAAFVSVSLAITTDGGQVEAQQYVDDFIAGTEWTPTAIHLAAGAVRFLEYDFFKEFTVKHLVLHGEKDFDKSAGNPEYTDWNALDSFIRSFLGGSIAQAKIA